MSENGVETDPEKINKVKNWPVPTNADEVRSFVSFAGYYRRQEFFQTSQAID